MLNKIILSVLFGVVSLGIIGFSDVYAANTNLFVSAENPLFDNAFAGPQVIEVTISDSSISDIFTPQPEPDVTINGKSLRMIQSDDGNWYAYFAILDQAQLADSTVGQPGFGLDFGEFCESASLVAGIDLSDTDGFSIARDIPSGSNGQDLLGSCIDSVTDSDALVNHVVRESKTLNQNSGIPGQIDIDVDVWPLIQLYEIPFEDVGVQIEYNLGSEIQTVWLNYDTVDGYVDFFIDRPSYPQNSPVYYRLTDIQLNIDPTDEDSWTFGTSYLSPTIYYQIFDEDGQIDADGTLGAVDISDMLTDLQFEENGLLIIEPDILPTGFDAINFADNDLQEIIPGATISDAISSGGTFLPGTHPVTLTETSANVGMFVNFDSTGKSNVVTTDFIFDNLATITYNDDSSTIFVDDTTDTFVSVGLGESSYFIGDTLTVFGYVTPLIEIFQLDVVVTNPDDVVVATNQLIPSDDGTFSDQILMTGTNWDSLGNYKVILSYSDIVTELLFTLDTPDPGFDIVKSTQTISKIEGGAPPLSTNEFGDAVVNIGDLDGDGIDDLAVGDIGISDGGLYSGGVWILFLNPDGTVKSHQKITETQGGFTGVLDISDWFGTSITSLGDLDGDGITDIAVGARGDDDGGTNTGAVWILFLNPDGTVKANQKISDTQGGLIGGIPSFDAFGFSISNIGDLDDDGFTDIVVGAINDDDGGALHGAVWILFLNPDGTVKANQKISDTQGGFTGEIINAALFGYSVSGIGDLDGDNVYDITVGVGLDTEIENPNVTGAVWILFLNPDGTVKANQKISTTQGGFTGILDFKDIFGSSLSNVGDFDGDGISDLMVGATGDDDGGINKGSVWLLLLNPDGTVKANQKISDLKGGLDDVLSDYNFFGETITNMGDFNNDGIVDVVVGFGNSPVLSMLFLDSFPVESLFCNDMTVDELISSGLYNVIDNRDGHLDGDRITGTNNDDLILASDAGNEILSKKGNDCVVGGAGNDNIRGGTGDDMIFGLDGDDIIKGGKHNDVIYGGIGNDILTGSANDDLVFGEDGDDIVKGGNGDDALSCGIGTDTANGGKGTDTATADCETIKKVP